MDQVPQENAEAGPSTPPVVYPTAPTFRFTEEPRCVTAVSAGSLDSEVDVNFFRSARWCPDGTCILTTAEDRVFRLYDTPAESEPDLAQPPRCFTQPDAIHSSLWYPTESLAHPETFCFMASIRDTPIRLIDATDGRVRATYPIVDHRERFIAPHAMAFNPDASRLYCGHENAVEVFDIATPGHGGSERIKTSSAKRDKGGQKGIISALAFSTDYSGLYAAGSFSGSVSLYQEDHDGSVGHVDGIEPGGVTQLQFHPLSPNHLFIASRRSDCIQLYDIRNPSESVATLPRKGDTNQRLWFDLDPWGRYLSTGDQDGSVSTWDIGTMISEQSDSPTMVSKRKLASGTLMSRYKLTSDAIGSVQIHPFKPIILAAAGSRSTSPGQDDANSGSSESESDSEDEDTDDGAEPANTADRTYLAGRSSVTKSRKPPDDSLRIWSFA